MAIVSQVWHEEYDRPLGAPLGEATLVGGIYARLFASGTRVTYNASSDVGAIQWANITVGNISVRGKNEP